MENLNPIILALIGTGLAAISTMIGASTVFFFKKDININFGKLSLGFAAGVMIAASIFALLLPAFEFAQELAMNEWLPVSIGFTIGGLFLFWINTLLTKLRKKVQTNEEKSSVPPIRRAIMLSLAIALHNIPEGLAVGLILGTATQSNYTYQIVAAALISLGMIFHNLPEGMAVSIPLRNEGFSKWKAFGFGAAAAIVEPIAGVLGVILVGRVEFMMPGLLSFAAGAMIYVVAQELIPETSKGKPSHFGTFGLMIGFLMMMILEVILG